MCVHHVNVDVNAFNPGFGDFLNKQTAIVTALRLVLGIGVVLVWHFHGLH